MGRAARHRVIALVIGTLGTVAPSSAVAQAVDDASNQAIRVYKQCLGRAERQGGDLKAAVRCERDLLARLTAIMQASYRRLNGLLTPEQQRKLAASQTAWQLAADKRCAPDRKARGEAVLVFYACQSDNAVIRRAWLEGRIRDVSQGNAPR